MTSGGKIQVRNVRKRGTVVKKYTVNEVPVKLFKQNIVIIRKAVF